MHSGKGNLKRQKALSHSRTYISCNVILFQCYCKLLLMVEFGSIQSVNSSYSESIDDRYV